MAYAGVRKISCTCLWNCSHEHQMNTQNLKIKGKEHLSVQDLCDVFVVMFECWSKIHLFWLDMWAILFLNMSDSIHTDNKLTYKHAGASNVTLSHK